MRRVLVSILCGAVSASIAGASPKTGWSEDLLAGKVKSVKETRVDVNRKDDVSIRTTRYDATGRRLEWVRTSGAGEIKDRTVYTYTASGVIGELSYYGPKNTPDTTAKYTYNDKGQRIELSNFDGKGVLKDRTVSTYDAAGVEIEASRYDAKGVEFAHVKYTHDAQGRVTLEERSSRDGALVERVSYGYDANGFLTERHGIDSAGKTTTHERWTNDAHGNKLEWTVFDPDGAIKEHWAYQYTFDKTGNWVKRQTSRVADTSGHEARTVAYETTRVIEYW